MGLGRRNFGADTGGRDLSVMGRYTWRKDKKYDGLLRHVDAYTLRYNGEELAKAQVSSRGSDLWFWYGDDINTSREPKPLAEVKAEAVAHFKAKQ